MINLENFKEKIRISDTKEYVTYLLDSYVASGNLPISIGDGTDFNEIFNYDSSSAGPLNLVDRANFLNKRLMIDYMKRVGVYDQYLAAESNEEKEAIYDRVSDELVDSIYLNENKLCISGSYLYETESVQKFEHFLNVNTDADNFYKVIRAIYLTAKKNNIPLLLFVANKGDDLNGARDSIQLATDSEYLEQTIALFDILPDEIKDAIKAPSSFGANVGNNVGYVSTDFNGYMTSSIGRSIVYAIDEAIDAFKVDIPEIEEFIESAYENSISDDEVVRERVRVAIVAMLKNEYPERYEYLVESIINHLKYNEINLETMFLSPEVEKGMTPQVNEVEAELETEVEPEGFNQDDQVIETPSVDHEELNEGERIINVEPPQLNFEASEDFLVGEHTVINLQPINEVETEESLDGGLEEESLDSIIQGNETLTEKIEIQVNEEHRKALLDIGFTEEDLNSKVLFKKTEMTLFEYFEYSKLLENVPLGNQVELSVDVAGFEAGDMLTTEEFIHVIVYHCATKIGEMSLQEIIDKYVKEMHLVSIANNKKNGFSLKNLFGMKK